MSKTRKIVGAVAQVEQQFFDTDANLAAAVRAIHEAARSGADVVVFGECFLGQYPYWANYYNSSSKSFARIWKELFDGAIKVGDERFRQVAEAARSAGIYVVMGCNELSDAPGSSTLYNTMLFFDRRGNYMGRHRKLMPTYHERMVHGQGDGRDLQTYNTDIGVLGGLVCWEHHMTLSKYAMASMGEEIHAASWPGMWRAGDPGQGERAIEPELGAPFTCDAEAAVRAYSIENGCFVLSAANYFPAENISDEWREIIVSLQSDWGVGGSSIVAPGGSYLVAPVINEEKILLAELDMDLRRVWKAFFDSMGHYSRPDVYNLQMLAPAGRERAYGVRAPVEPVREATAMAPAPSDASGSANDESGAPQGSVTDR